MTDRANRKDLEELVSYQNVIILMLNFAVNVFPHNYKAIILLEAIYKLNAFHSPLTYRIHDAQQGSSVCYSV
jgi:hypothetical protein